MIEIIPKKNQTNRRNNTNDCGVRECSVGYPSTEPAIFSEIINMLPLANQMLL